MRDKYILIVLSVVAAMAAVAVVVSAGNPDDPPGPPETTNSYTLDDIYNRLNAGTDGSPSTFTEPSAGPGTGTMHTINELMAAAPALDNTDGATPTQVLSGTTYWGLQDGAWGPQTGTMPNNGAVTLTPTTTNVAITAGYHDGSGYVAGDADLAAGNIRSGVSIFGVAGDPHVVNTASGDATAGDILSGTVAWVDGSEVTGSMPDNGALVITPTTTSQTIAAGYHDGSGYVVGDADLVAGNIKGGVSVFGVDGALYAPVPKTGQTQCYNTAGTEISCTDTGQDGDYQKGVTWPNPRFITSTTGIVTDTLTGLIWLQDASCTAFFSGDATGQNNRAWSDALMATNLLASGYCGLTDGSVAGDWRLPNAREMQSLAHYGFYNPAVPNTAGTGQWSEGDPFSGVQSISYWSGTTFASDTSFAWRVQLYYGSLVASTKADTYHVWPVRGGQ